MAKLNKITCHWSAGLGVPNNADLEHYHYLVDREGLIWSGKYKPEDNENCKDGKYAAHCGGGNTGNIGVAVCGMMSYNDKKRKCDNPAHDVTPVQMEAFYSLIASLCKQYDIEIKNVITHAEFGKTHPKSISAGKIDICCIPYANVYGIKECADFIRNKVTWYYNKRR